MAHEIELRHNIIMQLDGNWRLQIWTARTVDMTPRIFVYQRMLPTPYEDSQRDIFVNMAQACDISEYPEDEPSGKTGFFRKEYMDIVLQSTERLDITLGKIRGDVRDLCKTLDALEP